MSDRADTLALFGLLLVVAALLVLDWWREGQLEDLATRVDELETRRRRAKPKPTTGGETA